MPTAELRFDIGRLVKRLVSVADWLARYPETCRLGIGLCGASAGAAAALAAAAERPQSVAASVETS